MSVRGNACDCGNYTILSKCPCYTSMTVVVIIIVLLDTYRWAGGDDGLRGGGAYTYQTHVKSKTKISSSIGTMIISRTMYGKQINTSITSWSSNMLYSKNNILSSAPDIAV